MSSEETANDANIASNAQIISNPSVLNKYNSAADITNAAIQYVITLCVEGADIHTICKNGDTFIENEIAKVYNKKGKKIEKGISFPTCISVNDFAAYYSPLKDESTNLENGDLVKIELGCHIDGFIAMVGHSIVIQNNKNIQIEGRKADILMCTYNAIEAALRTIKIGNKNSDVTKIIEQMAIQYDCTPVMGTCSHKLKKNLIDDSHIIINKPYPEEKCEEFQFEANEVYELNVVMSTGTGKLKETNIRTTVFRRAVETVYNLKSSMARNFIATVNKQFPLLPFSLNAFTDLKLMKVGSAAASLHKLITPYPVLAEKRGECVCMFKYTILILPGGVKKITGCQFDQISNIKTNYEIKNEELQQLLSTSTTIKKKKGQDSSQNEVVDEKMEIDG